MLSRSGCRPLGTSSGPIDARPSGRARSCCRRRLCFSWRSAVGTRWGEAVRAPWTGSTFAWSVWRWRHLWWQSTSSAFADGVTRWSTGTDGWLPPCCFSVTRWARLCGLRATPASRRSRSTFCALRCWSSVSTCTHGLTPNWCYGAPCGSCGAPVWCSHWEHCCSAGPVRRGASRRSAAVPTCSCACRYSAWWLRLRFWR